MARRPFASGGNLDEHIAEAAKGRDGPRVSLHAERRFHLADKSLGRDVSPSAEPPKTLRINCAADSTVASEAVTADERAGAACGLWRIELLRLRLFAAQFELQPPAMCRVPRFTPEFERANLRETRSQTHRQIESRASFCRSATNSPAEHDDVRSASSNDSDFAVGIVPRARTV